MTRARIGRLRRAPALSPPKRAFLDALAGNSDVAVACAAAGVAPETPYRWRREDDAFRAAWQRVLMETCARIESALLAQAETQLATASGAAPPPAEFARLLAVVKHCRMALAEEPDDITSEVDMDELTTWLMDRLQAMVAAGEAGA